MADKTIVRPRLVNDQHRPREVPSVLDPSRQATVARAGTIGSAWVMPEVRWASVSTVFFLVASGLHLAHVTGLLTTPLFLACYVAGGWEPLLAGLAALRDKTLDVDLLMIVAAIGAAAIGQFVDGGLLIVIFATSGAMEALATQRTQASVRALLTLAPERAVRLGSNGAEEVLDTADLAVGDLVLVRPGEQIGTDGCVLSGVSEVDQASITGEPLPVLRTPGDEVFAGTLNGEGALQVRVTRPAAESVVARIVALVEQASATKAKAQLFIERIEQRYSVGVVVSTVVVFVVPLLLGSAVQPALLRAMTFMIVASPCAVVLATMPPLLSAIANAGRHGVLVKSAIVMEQLATTGQVAFDKTGTLTKGTPRVSEVVPFGTLDSRQLLSWAAIAERSSEHPLGRAVVAAARARDIAVEEVDAFTSVPGRGVVASAHGRRLEVGSPVLLEEIDHASTIEAHHVVTALEEQGRTAVVVIVDGLPVGVLGLADQLRSAARQTVAALAAAVAAPPVLLTGDNPLAARRLAQEVGIEQVRAGLLPHDKVREVRALQAQGHRVLVVGDGVNDAPALAAADIGVAMGRHGSDLALHTADAVIVRDDLATLPAVIDLSKRARRAVKQNLILAGTAIVSLIAWDLLGHLPLPLGVAGHEGGTVLVGLNGLRLLRERAWQ